MANLSYQRVRPSGLDVVHSPVSAGGDLVPGSTTGCVVVTNGSAAAVTVTVSVPGTTEFGLPEPDLTVSVPANDVAFIGPMSQGLVDPELNGVQITCSSTASVTIAAIVV